MKKVFSIVMALLLLISSSSLNANINNRQDCESYASEATEAEVNWYYGNDEPDWVTRYAVYQFWLGYCEGSGGSAAQPVFIG